MPAIAMIAAVGITDSVEGGRRPGKKSVKRDRVALESDRLEKYGRRFVKREARLVAAKTGADFGIGHALLADLATRPPVRLAAVADMRNAVHCHADLRCQQEQRKQDVEDGGARFHIRGENWGVTVMLARHLMTRYFKAASSVRSLSRSAVKVCSFA